MNKVLLVTGPAGDAQGWGDIEVTKSIQQAIIDSGNSAEIVFVRTVDEFYQAIHKKVYDIVWSALYHISSNSKTIGMNTNGDNWLADIMDRSNIPYIGPNAETMKVLIHKTKTHQRLKKAGVAVPYHFEIGRGQALPEPEFPAFVKPSCESRSVGISDHSVVHNMDELKRQVAWIHNEFEQPALIEEYLPGQEYTVLMIGNGKKQEFLAGRVEVDPSMFGKYPILRADLRGVGLTRIKPTHHKTKEAIELAKASMQALSCHDHVRTDMRLDAHNRLKVIEVNGIPGMKPVKSWSPQMVTMQRPSQVGVMEDYRQLVHQIVTSALKRHNIA